MKIKALSLKDIKGGKPYIRILVTDTNKMYLEVKTFLGVPQKICGHWWLRTCSCAAKKVKNHSFSREMGYESAGDMGLDLKPYDNQHRVFEFNTDTMRTLGNLVSKQDFQSYLKLINL